MHEDKNFTSQDYYEYLKYWGENNAAKIAKRYPLSLFNQTGSTKQAVYAALTTITTVSRLLCTAYYVMRSAEAAGVASYMYRWNHTLSCPFDIVPNLGPFPSAEERPIFGPTHISDVPFAFGNLDRMPLGNGSCNATSAEHALSKTMRASWTAMANGDPSTSGLKWPRYNTCDSKGVVFGDEAKVETIGNSECQFWGEVWKDITGSNIPFLGEKPSCSGNNFSTPSGGASSTSGIPSQSPSAHIAVASIADPWTRLHTAACVAVAIALLG